MPRLENGLLVLAKGYAWLPDKRRALGRRTVPTRLGGMPAVGLEGPDAARFLYDEDHVLRSGAQPEPVQATLFGKGSVHSLDGEAHRVRKAMYVALLMREDGIASLVQEVVEAWDDAAGEWSRGPEIVLFDAAAEVIAGAVCRWAGMSVTDAEVPGVALDLVALVDGFATGGPRHFRARRARKRREAWLVQLVEGVRNGTAGRGGGTAERDPADDGGGLVRGLLGARADPLAGEPEAAGRRRRGLRGGVRARGAAVLPVRPVHRRQGGARRRVGRGDDHQERDGPARSVRAEPRRRRVGCPLRLPARALPRLRHRGVRAAPCAASPPVPRTACGCACAQPRPSRPTAPCGP
jgi:hypothetical protein